MTSETLARAEIRGRLLVQEARGGLKGEAWRVVVSTVLTSQARRRRTPKRNRRIPTIPAGRTDVGPVDVSAVGTAPRRSEAVGPAVGPGGYDSRPAPP